MKRSSRQERPWPTLHCAGGHKSLMLGLTWAALVGLLSIGAGCSTSFKYTPKHDQTYAPVANGAGLAIRTGQDSRPLEERRPGWAKGAEKIVARAIADEANHAHLFHRVKIHMDSGNLKKYSEIVQFRVTKFECFNQPAFLETTGREFLLIQGIRGALIAESIPTKYISEVEIRFEILDASTQQSAFSKTYSAMRSTSLNGYQGEKPKIRQTSEALEEVMTQFVADLTKIQLSRHVP